MNEESGGRISAHKRKAKGGEDSPPVKMAANFTHTKRGLFKDYVHIYTEDSKKEYPILISSMKQDTRIDLLKANSILKSCAGLMYVKPVGNFLLKAFFNNKKDANALLLGKTLLQKNEWQARIPYDHLETLGIIKTPKDISEEDLLNNIKADCDIIGVKRFMRKNSDGSMSPTPTVLVTFLSSTRPDHVTYDYIWFDVMEYIKPVRQCFVCYKFGHGRGSCRSSQLCSICAGNHFFKDCNDKENIKCINCNGKHISISNSCPIKSAKNQELKDKINGKISYASVTAKIKSTSVDIPSSVSESTPSQTKLKNLKLMNVPQKRMLYSDILNSDDVLNVLTKTLVDLSKKGSQSGDTISSRVIKELLISNFAS